MNLNDTTNVNDFKKEVNPIPSKELKEALREGERILDGKINSKGYHDIKKMINDILNEE